MSTSSADSIFGLTCGFLQFGTGFSLAQYFDVSQVGGANWFYLKHMSGGSVLIQGAPYGGTLTTAFTSGYQMDTGEKLNFLGPVRGYLLATGATAVMSYIIGKSPNI